MTTTGAENAVTAPPQTKTTYHLEMANRVAFRPSAKGTVDFHVVQVEIPCPELNWFLHQLVGVDYRWGGRERWGPAEWSAYVRRPELETWVAYVQGTPAGYYELERQDDGSVRIECFGLAPDFVGKGLGGPVLSEAVARCWAMGAVRVWLNTCSHDHPHALNNYLARGFRVIRQSSGPPNEPHVSGLFSVGRVVESDEPA